MLWLSRKRASSEINDPYDRLLLLEILSGLAQ